MAEASVTQSARPSRASAIRKANDQLHAVCAGYHPAIPLSKIFDAARIVGEPIQEDGTPWTGILCGRNGGANIEIRGSKCRLHFQWYTMESGRYEVVAYIA